MLTARTDAATGQMMAQAMIHASRGFVDSTNRVGCRGVPGQGSSDSPWLLWLSLLPAASLLVAATASRLTQASAPRDEAQAGSNVGARGG